MGIFLAGCSLNIGLLLTSIGGFLGNFLEINLSFSRDSEDLDTGNLSCLTFGREKTSIILTNEMFMVGRGRGPDWDWSAGLA